MQIVISGKLENVYKSKDFTDKDSGEVTKGKYQLQFMERVESEEGAQLVVHKISIPQDKAKQYQGKVGENVQVPVKSFAQKGNVIYYGV